MKYIVVICALLVGLTSCVSAQYIGKSYMPTTSVDLFMTWEDVPGDYEIMGYVDATPNPLASMEDAQKKVERLACEKGADAIVFEGIDTRFGNTTYETTEKVDKNLDGSITKKTSTSKQREVFNTLKVTLIKYRR